MILVPLLNPKFASTCRTMCANFGFAALVSGVSALKAGHDDG